MKIEEILKYAKQGLEDALEFGYNDMAVMFWEEIIKLLEKQIPKEPILLKSMVVKRCPVCKCVAESDCEEYGYCQECGQALKWGE